MFPILSVSFYILTCTAKYIIPACHFRSVSAGPFPKISSPKLRTHIRSSLHWNFTQRRGVVCYRRFRTTCRSHLSRIEQSEWKFVSNLSWQSIDTIFKVTWSGTDRLSRNFGNKLPLCCIKSQKNECPIYTAAEAWGHAQYAFVHIT